MTLTSPGLNRLWLIMAGGSWPVAKTRRSDRPRSQTAYPQTALVHSTEDFFGV